MTEQPKVVGKSILLVDDQPEVRQTIRMLLDLDDHIITEASNGRQALELFKAGKFDLVVTDYFMPGMLGDQLAARIKELSPSQAILMVTGSADQNGGPPLQVDAILRKPFFLEELRRAVAQLLGESSKLQVAS